MHQAAGPALTCLLPPVSYRPMIERRYRSLIKALSWRLTGSLDTLLIAFIITGKVKWALSISGVELFTKMFLYYVHERLWNRIPIGRIREPRDKPNFEI